jgi:hypothetical protein
MRTPPTFVIFRVTAVTITVLVLLLFGMGLGGLGPLDGLGVVTSHALSWLHINTGGTPR